MKCGEFAESQRDVGYAFYPDSLILIISLMDNNAPQIAAFQISEGRIEKKAIKVMKARRGG